MNIIVASLLEFAAPLNFYCTCFWADADEFALPWDYNFFCKLFHEKRHSVGDTKYVFLVAALLDLFYCVFGLRLG
jgi:hypothetical protein